MLLLFINAKDKTSQRVKTDVNFGSAHALFVICTRVTRECTRFSQSDVRNISCTSLLLIPSLYFITFDIIPLL